MRTAVAALLVAVAIAPVAAHAAETVSVGSSTFLFVPGESIKVMDVTAPYMPLQVAEIPIQSWEFAHIPMNGGAYLAAMDADNALHILDVTAPYRPVPVSVLQEPAGKASASVLDVDWARSGERTFALLSAGNAVHVIDITDPQNPTPVGDIRNGDPSVSALDEARDSEPFWIGQEPYVVVAGSDAVQVVDFGTPTAPSGVSVIRQGQYGFATIGSLQDIDVIEAEEGVYALILGETSLMVADITDPTHPIYIDTMRYNSLFEVDVLEAEGALYALIMCVDKIHVIDMLDPEHPVFVSTIPVPTAGVAGVESEGRHWALSVGDTIAAVDITDPVSPVPAYVREGGPPYAPEAVETAVIGGKLYSLTASVARSTIQITEITEPDNPVPVAAVVGGQHAHGSIHGPHDVAIAETNGRTYAVVPNIYSHSVAILDVTEPRSPRIVSNTDLPVLAAPTSVAVVDIGSSTYAAVTGFYSNGIRLLDITDPRSPSLGVLILDDQYGFESVGDPLSVEAVTIDGSPYILVASYYGNSVQIIDVSNPDAPAPAAAVFDGVDGHHLEGAHDIEAIHTEEGTLAVVSTARDSGISVIDITNPHAPSAASHVVDGRDGFNNLNTVQYLDAVNHGSRTLVVATSYFDNAIQLVDITNPGAPTPLSSVVQGMDGFDALIGPTGVSAIRHGAGTYVVVADYFGNGIQIVEITADGVLKAISTVAAGLDASLHLATSTGVESATISGRTYALTATPSQDVVQITDITDPLIPTVVSLIRDGEGGFVMDGPVGIETGSVSGMHYAFITGLESESVQVADISNPAMPEPLHLILEGMGWVVETEFTYVDRTPYLIAGTRTGDTIHVIDVSDPSRPDIVAALPDAIPAIQGLDIIHTAEGVLVIVFSFDQSTMHIIDITDPANPHRISAMDGEHLYSVTDVDAITAGDRTLAAVSSYRTDTVSVVDITDPRDPVLLSSVQGRDGGHYLHGPESVQVAAIGDGVFVAISNGNDSMQLMDITDPLRPVVASTPGILFGSTVYGVTDVEIVSADSGTYVLFQTIDENVTILLDATDPYEPVALSPIPPLHRLASFQ